MPIAMIRELLKDPESLSLDGTMNSFGRGLLSKHLEELTVRQIQVQNQIRDLSEKLNPPALGTLKLDVTSDQDSSAAHEKILVA